MTQIPLHQDPQWPHAAMAVLPTQFSKELKARARLAFTMVNLAAAAGRKRMLQQRYKPDSVFGGFTTKFVSDRMTAAYPQPVTPPELTKKQLARLEENERYREAVIAQGKISLTNYEQNQWMLAKRRAVHKTAIKPESFKGCRGW